MTRRQGNPYLSPELMQSHHKATSQLDQNSIQNTSVSTFTDMAKLWNKKKSKIGNWL